jgi:hypothetical protein
VSSQLVLFGSKAGVEVDRIWDGLGPAAFRNPLKVIEQTMVFPVGLTGSATPATRTADRIAACAGYGSSTSPRRDAK